MNGTYYVAQYRHVICTAGAWVDAAEFASEADAQQYLDDRRGDRDWSWRAVERVVSDRPMAVVTR